MSSLFVAAWPKSRQLPKELYGAARLRFTSHEESYGDEGESHGDEGVVPEDGEGS